MKRMKQDASLAISSLIIIFFSMFIPHLEASLIAFLLGSGLAFYGSTDFMLMVSNKKLSFRKNEKGVGWILAVAALSVVFTPFLYFFLAAPFDQLVTYFTGVYTFTGTTALVISAVRVLVSYLIIFTLINTVVWTIVTSKAENRGGY